MGSMSILTLSLFHQSARECVCVCVCVCVFVCVCVHVCWLGSLVLLPVSVFSSAVFRPVATVK